MQLYVSKNGQRYGPYSLEELRQEVLANVFRPEHFASSDNGRTWEPISAVPGIGPLVYAVDADVAQNLLIIRYRGYILPSHKPFVMPLQIPNSGIEIRFGNPVKRFNLKIGV